MGPVFQISAIKNFLCYGAYSFLCSFLPYSNVPIIRIDFFKNTVSNRLFVLVDQEAELGKYLFVDVC